MLFLSRLNLVQKETMWSLILYMKSWFPKPLTSTPTCYSFATQVTAKKPISTPNLLQMENVDTNWNLKQEIAKNSNSTILRTAFWPCHKIWAYIMKNKGIKSCLVPKPPLSAPACHSSHFKSLCKHCTLRQMEVTHNYRTYYMRFELFQ